MPEIDVQDELVEEFEPSDLPPAARDGSLELPPLRAAPKPHPRLCEQGPCDHYHRFQIQMDAEQERPQKQPDGSFTTPARSFHVQTHHYCYPTAGVEMRLGALPILQCNRWRPVGRDADDRGATETVRDAFRRSPEGLQYAAELEAWKAERAEIDKEIAEAERQAAEDLAAMPTSADLSIVVESVAGIRYLMPATWTDSIAHVAMTAGGQIGLAVVVSDYNFYDGKKLLNPTVTVAQAGLSNGDIIRLERKKGTP